MSAPIQHPSWCDRGVCTVSADGRSGAHLSTPAVLHPGPKGWFTSSVYLYQGAPLDGYPDSDVVLVIVEFRVSDFGPGWPAVEFGISLDGERAVQLSRLVADHGREAQR